MNHLILLGGHYSLFGSTRVFTCVNISNSRAYYAVSVSVVTLWHCVLEIHLNFLTPFPLWCNSNADTCTYVCLFFQRPPLPRLVCQNTLVTRHWELPPYHENWFTVWLLMCTIWWYFIHHTHVMWTKFYFKILYDLVFQTNFDAQSISLKWWGDESFTLCDIFPPCNFMLKNKY